MTPILAFQSIFQTFPASPGAPPLEILHDISFTVPKSRFVAIIGPSGCGKSTLLQMAAGLLQPSAGQVLHAGTPIAGVNRDVGLVPQQPQLFPWKTLAQNVEFPLALRGVPPAERHSRAARAIAAVDLAGFENHYPYQLSGGMQKRASIARTLVYHPEIILMDEPFGALDAQTRMLMQHDLQSLVATAAATVLFVTHDITEAILLADQLVILSRRPTRRLATLEIPLPRPRNIYEPAENPGFAATYDQAWQIFRTEIRPA